MWTEQDLKKKMAENPSLKIDMPDKGLVLAIAHGGLGQEPTVWRHRTKYRSKRTEYNRVWYQSKKEAEFARDLDLQKAAGVVKFWLRQVPFQLPGAVYRLDFLVAYPNGEYRLYDVKGWDTPVSKLKRKMVEQLYPVSIEVV